jgi:hypothetical protein
MSMSRPELTASVLESVAHAAHRLGQHPQDHGWRELFRLLDYGFQAASYPLRRTIRNSHAGRPTTGHAHLITVLAIAVKSVAPASLSELTGTAPAAARLSLLDAILVAHDEEIQRILSERQNSFTAARRFLLPQVILGARFSGACAPCRFADLGTGLGILPRQLNSRSLYERFAPDLRWPMGTPLFRPVPLEARFGVDRGPMPDLSWVTTCYGPSTYYSDLYDELLFVMGLSEVRDAHVDYTELDLLDSAKLSNFMESRRVNAVNVGYVLYEMEPSRRVEILRVLQSSLHPPGVVVVSEPNQDLTQPGCEVRLYDHAHPSGLSICAVSDGHFRGTVIPMDGFDAFSRVYRIMFSS